MASAKQRILLDGWTVEDIANEDFHLPRPFAIVGYPKWILVDTGSQCWHVSASVLQAYFTMDHPRAAGHDEGYITFANLVGEVLLESVQHGGPQGVLNGASLSMSLAPQRTPRSQRSKNHDFWEAAFALTLKNAQ